MLQNKPIHKKRKNIICLIASASLLLLSFILMSLLIGAVPSGPIITYNTTENGSIAPGLAITTAGGSFTTLVLNVTTQNFRWKAYVGNITGRLVLMDSNNYSIYDWAIAQYTGEIYASRNNSLSWADVSCANSTTISSEQQYMNHTSSNVDSIVNTFNSSKHKLFYVGTKLISNSTCNSTATYLNSTRQILNETSLFQEVLLQDSRHHLIYTAPLENSQSGFDTNRYNFQMIVAESDKKATATTYYFFVEII